MNETFGGNNYITAGKKPYKSSKTGTARRLFSKTKQPKQTTRKRSHRRLFDKIYKTYETQFEQTPIFAKLNEMKESIDAFEIDIMDYITKNPIDESRKDEFKEFYLSSKTTFANTFVFVQCMGEYYFDFIESLYVVGLSLTKKGNIELLNEMDRHFMKTPFAAEVSIPSVDYRNLFTI
jgi:hypothetical protein